MAIISGNKSKRKQQSNDANQESAQKKTKQDSTEGSSTASWGKASKLVEDLNCLKEDDVFHRHLNRVEDEISCSSDEVHQLRLEGWQHLKYTMVTEQVKRQPPTLLAKNELSLVPLLYNSIPSALQSYRKGGTPHRQQLTALQREVLSVACSYKDLGFQRRTHETAEDLTFAYALHALNHVLKSYITINRNNILLKEKSVTEVRDKGFTRPKVLILLPYRHSAYRLGMHIINLLKRHITIANKQRFHKDFFQMSIPRQRKSEEFNQNFTGNIDEDFKFGIRLNANTLTFYSDFYSSDIIVASLMGLRTVVKAEGEKNRDFEFLSSIEILILDQFDSLLMQNMESLAIILQSMHHPPRKTIDKADVCRVRRWMLNGQGKYYRQTLIFSNYYQGLVNRIIFNECFNYQGGIVSLHLIYPGAIGYTNSEIGVAKEFIRLEPNSEFQASLEYFKNRIFPRLLNKSHVLIYVPSSIEARQIMKLLTDNDRLPFGITEEAPDSIEKTRSRFYKGELKITFLTERVHFYSEYVVKGVRHIVFLQLPRIPRLFALAYNFLSPELSNEDALKAEPNPSCTVIFSESDWALEEVVGSETVKRIEDDEDDNIFKL